MSELQCSNTLRGVALFLIGNNNADVVINF